METDKLQEDYKDKVKILRQLRTDCLEKITKYKKKYKNI